MVYVLLLLQIPATTSAHDVAATLLAFFASLPSPFMPPAAAQVCDVCVPSASAASSLLADSLSPAEWAVFRHTSGQTAPNSNHEDFIINHNCWIQFIFDIEFYHRC